MDDVVFSQNWSCVFRWSLERARLQVNQAGLDFYSRLVDALLAAGLEPHVTVYHWGQFPEAHPDQSLHHFMLHWS